MVVRKRRLRVYWIRGGVVAFLIFLGLSLYTYSVEEKYIEQARAVGERVTWRGGLIAVPPPEVYKGSVDIEVVRTSDYKDVKPQTKDNSHTVYIFAKIFSFAIPLSIILDLVILTFFRKKSSRHNRVYLSHQEWERRFGSDE